ncbi:lachesin-like isoform X10 [Vespa velutina]|uniref:lachesin-like isoform X10 n=1 Tax=Vespa velutina TaxID=202808 RepID=UPI001FB523BC|nr:lachesin-like isoform X10 [Vespa velutina]
MRALEPREKQKICCILMPRVVFIVRRESRQVVRVGVQVEEHRGRTIKGRSRGCSAHSRASSARLNVACAIFEKLLNDRSIIRRKERSNNYVFQDNRSKIIASSIVLLNFVTRSRAHAWRMAHPMAWHHGTSLLVSFSQPSSTLVSIAWIKSDSRAILAIHTHMVAHNTRLSVTHNGHNTWKLHVSNVQPNDSGTYMCQINTDPMKSQTGYMKVVIPPDIMDLDDSADLLTTKESNDLRLRCRATGTPKPTVTWRREDGREITLRSELGVKRVQSYEGEQLHLVGILRQEMGSYLCIASNGVPPTVSKRYHVNVLFKPLIKVTNQLVAAPTNSNVILQCYVESSPKASNTWYKDNGEFQGINIKRPSVKKKKKKKKTKRKKTEKNILIGIKLLTNDKHNVSEFTVNDYAYQLNLTIKQLSRNDFGSYICSAENPYGKAEGTIRLQD